MMNQSDVVVVGGGILGVAHAWAAAKRGLSVTLFERSQQPHGATIRNFGQVLVTGQSPGMMLSHAQQTGVLWKELASLAGFHTRTNGSLVVARSTHEERVLEQFAAERIEQEGYRARLMGRIELAKLFNGRLSHHLCAIAGEDDVQIYCREALPAIHRYLSSIGVKVFSQVLVKSVQDGVIETTVGEFQADHVYVCPGHDYQTVLADLFGPMHLEVSRLQMLRLAVQGQALELDRPLLTGLSCVHYGAFSDLSSAAELKKHFETESPFLMKNGIHLLISPTPYGELIVGDSHHYGQDSIPFCDEEIDQALIDLTAKTLQCNLKVIERWQGVYGAHGPAPFSVLRYSPKVTAAVMHSGVGMTVGLAIGERTVAENFS
jgi:FAD dependent oxidoreductase TIGR03364